MTGKPVFTLDAHQIQSDLLAAFPEFNAAQVLVEIPNTVLITVTERLPVMVWLQEGKSYLVDKDGMTFPVRHEGATGELPVVDAAGAPPGVVLPDKARAVLARCDHQQDHRRALAGCACAHQGCPAALDGDGPVDPVDLRTGSGRREADL